MADRAYAEAEREADDTVSAKISGLASGCGIRVMRATGAFGVRGLVRARIFSDNLKAYKRVRASDGRVLGFKIVRFVGGDSVIIALDGVSDRDQALEFKGMSFYVDRDDLEKPSEDEYYVCDLVGKEVEIVGGPSDGKAEIVDVPSGVNVEIVDGENASEKAVSASSKAAEALSEKIEEALPKKSAAASSKSAAIAPNTEEAASERAIEYRVTNVFNFGAGDLIEISYDGGNFLVPFKKVNFPDGGSGNKILLTFDAFTCYRE